MTKIKWNQCTNKYKTKLKLKLVSLYIKLYQWQIIYTYWWQIIHNLLTRSYVLAIDENPLTNYAPPINNKLCIIYWCEIMCNLLTTNYVLPIDYKLCATYWPKIMRHLLTTNYAQLINHRLCTTYWRQILCNLLTKIYVFH